MTGLYLPLPEPLSIGDRPPHAACTVCWQVHAEPLLILRGLGIGWSCAPPVDREAYAGFMRQQETVLASNYLPADVRAWFDGRPTGLTPIESAAYLLYRMGAIPTAAVRWLEGIRCRPKPLGAPGDRIETIVVCQSVTEQPATDYGPSFVIAFRDGEGRLLIWRTGVGGFDPQPSGQYRIRTTVRSHETFGGEPCTYITRTIELGEDGEPVIKRRRTCD